MKKYLVALLCLISINKVNAQYENTKIEIGQKAPTISCENPQGEKIDLLSLTNKRVVLLDFWASWCGPCRMSNPGLVKFYEKYKSKKYKKAKKGFTIVSVSLDKAKDPWVKAIETDKLSWENHLCDYGGWNSTAAGVYGVQFVPQCFLIDGTGTVIGKYSRAEDCEKDLEKLLAK